MNELKRRCTNTCAICGKKFVGDHKMDVICSEECSDKFYQDLPKAIENLKASSFFEQFEDDMEEFRV